MRFRTIMTDSSCSVHGDRIVSCLSVAISPDALASQPHSRLFKEAAERASVSGKISAIGDASFSVDVSKGQDPVTFQFLIDDTITVEGRLKVGAHATRDYRTTEPTLLLT
jgi:hypothetical protein